MKFGSKVSFPFLFSNNTLNLYPEQAAIYSELIFGGLNFLQSRYALLLNLPRSSQTRILLFPRCLLGLCACKLKAVAVIVNDKNAQKQTDMLYFLSRIPAYEYVCMYSIPLMHLKDIIPFIPLQGYENKIKMYSKVFR